MEVSKKEYSHVRLDVIFFNEEQDVVCTSNFEGELDDWGGLLND